MQDFGKVNCSLHAAPRRADVSPQLQEVWLRSNNRGGGAPSPYISTTANYWMSWVSYSLHGETGIKLRVKSPSQLLRRTWSVRRGFPVISDRRY